MRDFCLSCCSTVDLNNAILNENEIHCLFHTFTLDGQDYRDDFGETMSYDEFYRRLVEGADAHTSQINIADYLDYFDATLASGKDVLHLCMSSGMSGTINSARNADAIACERHPEGRVVIVDSLCESGGYGMLMLEAAARRREGKTIDEVAAWVEANRLKMQHWFFSTDLTFFIKGGRVSKTAGFFGGLLGICPVMYVDGKGRIIPRAKARSRKRAMQEVVDRMARHARNSLSYNERCFITHSHCIADAEETTRMVKERFPEIKEIQIFDIGTVVGVHCGPGTVALFFWGDGREETA